MFDDFLEVFIFIFIFFHLRNGSVCFLQGINETSIATEQVISMSTEIATHRKGATLYLTVYPTINVAEISNQTLWEFALLLRRVNVEIGVDIFLAWCSDMNGEKMVCLLLLLL